MFDKMKNNKKRIQKIKDSVKKGKPSYNQQNKTTKYHNKHKHKHKQTFTIY